MAVFVELGVRPSVTAGTTRRFPVPERVQLWMARVPAPFHPNHRDGPSCACRELGGDGVAGCGGRVVRSLMSAIAAHSRASRMAATAESLSLYVPDTASTFPERESSLNSKSPRLVTTSSNVPVTVDTILGFGAPL